MPDAIFIALHILDIIDRSGLSYRLGPMGTCMEGETEAVLAVVRQCFDELLRDSNRVTCTLKMDYRTGRRGSLDGKVRSIEERVGRKLRT